jgi:hemerythrin superfamily protein
METTAAAATNDPIAWLKADHALIRGHLDAISSTAWGSERVLRFEALKKLLAVHNAIEENLVYPALAKVAGAQERAFDLFHETAEADVVVYTMTRALRLNDEVLFNEQAGVLMDALLTHVHEEEEHAFPLLEAAPAAEVRALADEIVAFRKTIA